MNIFQQLGQATTTKIGSLITALKGAANTWTGTNTFKNGIEVGTDSETANTAGLTVGTTTKNQTLNVYGATTLHGNLSVGGTTTAVNSTNLEVQDNIIRLNKGANELTTDASDSGFVFERKQGADDAKLEFNEANDRFQMGIGNELGTLAIQDILIGTLASNKSLGTLDDFVAGFLSTGPTTPQANYLQLDADGKLPAVDGSNLTNLPFAQLNTLIEALTERVTELEDMGGVGNYFKVTIQETSTNILARTGDPVGTIAFATDTNDLYIFNASGFDRWTSIEDN